ncbi:hypothetical protein EST38_g12902 [Candolleomyces aberdarensis]|uniref:Uncharacterized protein n=1 Tax=Candolleomyces aberdarensis TaxID=2316362 RepID=A0A4Q2D2F7_9AGAR|nr:hypothetical protein EST38_g12902 [Candolleomyces aberdarensis]
MSVTKSSAPATKPQGRKKKSNKELTESDLKICDDVRRQFKDAPLPQRSRLLSTAITEIIEGYRVQHNLEEVDAFMQERIDKAVRKWIREKTRSRVRAAKIGTKSYSARRVFYQQNKDKVKKCATELQKEGDGPWPIGTTAKALTQLYETLPKEEVEKLQTIANEWNAMGPGEEVHLDTAIKAIPKRSLAFFEDCRKQYGAVFFVLYAHKTSKGVQAGMMDYTRNMAGDGRSFSSKMKAEIADSGVQEIWEEYVNANWGVMEAKEEAGVRRLMGKSRKTMHLPVNEWGEPILPDLDLVAESGELPAEFSGLREYLQTMLRTFLSMHWGLAGPVTSKEPTVPWSDIIKEPRQYIRPKYLPDDLVDLLKDPSKVPIGDCLALLIFWLERQRDEKDVVFKFSHWQQSRHKSPVPREPRRKAPTIPDKPGYKNAESEGGSDEEMETRQTRSKEHSKSSGKGKETSGAKGKQGKSGGGKNGQDGSDEDLEDEWSDRESTDEEWADEDEWGGVAEDEGTVSTSSQVSSDSEQEDSDSDSSDGLIFRKLGDTENPAKKVDESHNHENIDKISELGDFKVGPPGRKKKLTAKSNPGDPLRSPSPT